MTQQEPAFEPSATLLAAQQRLLNLRQTRQAKQTPPALPMPTKPHGRCSPTTNNPLHTLPTHLGWYSERVTAVLQQHHLRQQTIIDSHGDNHWLEYPQTDPPSDQQPESPSTAVVKMYPDIALALLRNKLAASGRIWLLLRHLDTKGQGWIDVDAARAQLTPKDSPLRVCGWRQLRNLLAAGAGIFWQREGDRLWLRGISKVANYLAVEKLVGRPVAISLKTLLQNIGTVRAHFYATFHSGRKTKPVARETLALITAVPTRTQRLYDRRAKVQRQANFALGPRVNTAAAEDQAWQQGQAGFHLTDYNGKQGPPGTTYLAWQLPNSYTAPHKPQPRGRQQRINRELADLLTQGTTGNNQAAIEFNKRYFGSGRGAVSAAAKSTQKSKDSIYWYDTHRTIWYWIQDN